MAQRSHNKSNTGNNKAALKPVTLSLPGQMSRTLPAAEALSLLHQCQQQRQWLAVSHIARQLTQQLPSLEQSWLALFGFLHDSGNYPALAEEARRCLSRKPRFIPALISLAVSLRMAQQHDDALAMVDKALRLNPANAETLNHRGIILKEMGRNEQSVQAFNRCLALAPANVNAIWNRADMTGVLDEAEYQRCLALANSEKLSPGQRAMIFYALAQSDEKAADYARQFTHILTGARLKRAVVPYDHKAEISQINRVAGCFSGQHSASATAGAGQPVPIFICGLPRSGTTLTEQILSSHPAVSAGDERNDLPLAAAEVLQRKGIRKEFPDWAADLQDDDWQAIGAAYRHSTQDLQRGGWFTDKNLQNYKAIGLIRKALPEAKIIICRRDPMDNLWGCYRQYFADGMYFTYDLQELADVWHASDRLIQHWQQTGDDIFVVNYEQLTRNPQDNIRALLAFAGLPWDDACLNFHTNQRAVRTLSATQVRQPMTTARVAQWKRYEQQLLPLQQALGLT